MQDYQRDLTLICKDLMLEQPFYGLLLLNLNKEWSNKVKTAGVGVNNINYSLLINPEFWCSLSQDEKKGLLQHELMHIAFFHITEYKHLNNHTLANIAQDIEINQLIPKEFLPKDGCFIEKFKDYNLLPHEGTNAYYDKLYNENQNKCPDGLLQAIENALNNGETETDGQGENDIKIPEHEWDAVDQLSEVEKKLADKQLEIMLTKVVEEIEKQRGTVPSQVKIALEKRKNLEPPKFNWKSYLRRYISNSSKSSIRKTKRKQSKRFEEDFGIKIQDFSHVLIGIDSSASVSDKEIEEFMNEIHHMYKVGHDFTIVFCDTKMQEPFKFKPNVPIEIKKRGGTDFNPVVDYFLSNRKKYSTLIYLTDGEAPAPNSYIKNVLWVLSSLCENTDHLPGLTVKLN